jgi:hypothetical protein
MNIRAAKAGLKIHEVPSFERCRLFGASNLRAVRDGWRILKVILQERFSGLRARLPAELAAPVAAPIASGVLAEAGEPHGERA